MSFLSIPGQDGLFTAIRAERDDADSDEDADADAAATGSGRLIPRCSPVPRKRGASIHDETAEYMRIQGLRPGGRKRVAFADAAGGELIDVREFYAFDSDDEDADARWEEEEAKYRKPRRQPTYRLHPEFGALDGDALLRAVRGDRVAVESVSAVRDEPLAFGGHIRVLNVSFHKAVYVRATMDGWASYFDHPAEYVRGSTDADTDRFAFRLSFAPPYVTHGSRIEFVVRYETSDGDFWANNASLNYAVTLLLSYEEDAAPAVDAQEPRSILRPPKDYSAVGEFDSEDEPEESEDDAGNSESGLDRSAAACPVTYPEIDIEIAVHTPGPPNHRLAAPDGSTSNCAAAAAASPGGLPRPDATQTTSALPPGSSAPPAHAPPDLLPPYASSSPESRPGSSGGEEVGGSEDSGLGTPSSEENLWPSGDGSPDSHDGGPRPDPPAERVSSPVVPQCRGQEVGEGLSGLDAELPEGSAPPEELRPPPEAEAPGPAEPTGVAEVSSNSELHPVSTQEKEKEEEEEKEKVEEKMIEEEKVEEDEEEKVEEEEEEKVEEEKEEEKVEEKKEEEVEEEEEEEAAPQISPDLLLAYPASVPPEEPPTAVDNVNRNLMASVIALSGVVSLSIVLQEPSTLFFMGLLLVLHRL